MLVYTNGKTWSSKAYIHTPYFSPYLDGIVLVCATVKAIIVWLLSRNGINMRGDWSPEDRAGRGDSRDGAGRVVCVWFPWTPHEVWCVFDEVNTIDAAESRNHIFPHFMDGRSTHPLIRRQLFASTSQNFKCVPNKWFITLIWKWNSSLSDFRKFFLHLEKYLKIEGNEDKTPI